MAERFQLRIKTSVEEDEKPESGRFHGSAVAGPTVGIFAGGVIKPIASVCESLAQSLQIGVTGIVVAIETEVGRLRLRTAECDQCDAKTSESPYPSHELILLERR